ncbi:MAG: imidazole glycerol phosphate synthase subunit HisH [Ichthyobacteriaceae bacterium]|nr:imidazole glycerol phosphate synthase subunit HisH [Ichthyobacteriaceae bacterium]
MIVIVDYGAGNIQSVKFAFERLGVDAVLTSDVEVIKKADKVIFPGVGRAESAMVKLKATGLDKLIPALKQPVLGVCLGMQLMCKHTAEDNINGLDIFPLEVKEFPKTLKVPQIGWNQISELKTDLLKDVKEDSFVYFVHSFYVPDNSFSIASTNYGMKYSSAIKKDNFYATQFHPEKSGSIGEQILKNFLAI